MKRIVNAIYVVMTFLFGIVLFGDNDYLNSFLVAYNDIYVSEVNYIDEAIVYQNTQSNTNMVGMANNSNVIPVAANSWVWPTEKPYTITTYYSSAHNALDIYYGYGSNIYAANRGTVTMVMGGCVPGNLSCNGSGGNYVVIKHNNNYYSVYMHLASISVRVGDNVSSGQVIGKMGNTGNVRPVPYSGSPYLGTHLHFCLYVGVPFSGGYTINPMTVY